MSPRAIDLWAMDCACVDRRKNGGPGDGTSGRVARALYLDDAPRDFGPEVAFSLSFASLSDTWPLGQALRERNVGP